MKRGLLLLVFLLAITIAGGMLTADVAFGVPLIRQTTNPDASVFMASESQAIQFLAIVGFIIFNVIGAGLTLALVIWFLNWQVKVANETPTLEERRQQEADALPEGKKALSSGEAA